MTRTKPPRGYRIYLYPMGNAGYGLKIKKNGRQIYHPVDLHGWRNDCRKEAIAICWRNEDQSPDDYIW